MDPAGVGAEEFGEFVAADPGGLGAEPVQWFDRQRVAVDHPHAGLALGAGLGQEPGLVLAVVVGEHPSGQSELGFSRSFLVGSQAAALHEMDDMAVAVVELHHQILGPPPDGDEPVTDRPVGGWVEGLEHGEVQRFEPVEGPSGQRLGHSLAVGLNFRDLRHGSQGTRVGSAQ